VKDPERRLVHYLRVVDSSTDQQEVAAAAAADSPRDLVLDVDRSQDQVAERLEEVQPGYKEQVAVDRVRWEIVAVHDAWECTADCTVEAMSSHFEALK
jgi:hypothetical protein